MSLYELPPPAGGALPRDIANISYQTEVNMSISSYFNHGDGLFELYCRLMVSSKKIIRTFLLLSLLSTLATSIIWGINTLFLLDAGLSNAQAFAVNAFFTAGMVLFEIPTGIVADVWGRKQSYILGAITLLVATLGYYLLWQTKADFWLWAVISLLLGLGFTFFSGAMEAWLVDALKFSKFKGSLESILARGQIVSGAAMLSGSVLGGVLAQNFGLGMPYLIRGGLLLILLLTAQIFMRDYGFVPESKVKYTRQITNIYRSSIKYGLNNPNIKWLMYGGVFSGGVLGYAFYALQPYLLQLYGNPKAYSIAGLAAAIVAGAQIIGGFLVPVIRRKFKKRTSILISGMVVSALMLLMIGLSTNFYIVVGLVIIWAMIFAITSPVRQAYLNGEIPSKQRATVLSFDSLINSSGGVISQPLLGKAADAYSYGTTYLICSIIQLAGIPLAFMARRQHAKSDIIN